MRVEDARVAGDPADAPWAARLTLERGLLAPGEPELLRAEARGTLTDVRPLLGLASGGGLPAWIADVLGIADVEARARITAGERIRLGDLLARAHDLRVAGDLDLGKGTRRGRLLVTYKGFDLGLALHGRATDFKLLGAREWFDKGR